MLSLIFEGIIFGLVIAITPGPIFFAILQTGVNRGFRAGFFTATGVLLSDLVLISVCYLGISRVIEQIDEKIHVGIIGGIILIIFGTVTFIRKPEILRKRDSKINYKEPHISTYIFKGFFINISNPTLIFFWLSAMGIVTSQAEKEHVLKYVLAFFSATLFTIFATDLLKSFIGKKIKDYLNLRIQLLINKVVGIILGGAGIILIFKNIYILKSLLHL